MSTIKDEALCQNLKKKKSLVNSQEIYNTHFLSAYSSHFLPSCQLSITACPGKKINCCYFFLINYILSVFFPLWFIFFSLIDFDLPLWEPTSQGSPHLQTQLQDGSRLTFSWPFSYDPFHLLASPVHPTYRIFLQFLPWLPCHFYLVIKQQL